MEIGLYLVLIIFCTFLISKVVKFALISPIYIYILFYGLCITLTTLYYYYYEDKISIYNFDFIKSSLFLQAITFHLLAVASFCIGVLLYYDGSTKDVKKMFNKSLKGTLKFSYALPPSILPLIHVFIVTIILLCALSYGELLFFREDYLIEKNTSIITLMKLLSFVTVLMLGVSYKKQKWLSIGYFTIIILIATGTGSRLGVIYALVYALLIFMSTKSTLASKLGLVVNGILSFVYLAFLTSVRPLEFHGIVPYFSSIFGNETDVVSNLEFNIYYTFIFGIFVTSKTLVGNATDWGTIAISLNPLPGKWVGWYEIAGTLRANKYAPYTANGEVFTIGRIFTFLFFTVIGLAFGYLEHQMRKLFLSGSKVFGFIVSILCVMFVIYSFEYNLRSSVRYIYYALVVLLVYNFIGKYRYKMSFFKKTR
ncbi:MAG: hypothetical protein NWQ19_01710 [Nonlabens sp.]|nr:hypothetical protein [Nonlabens sp.]